LVHLQPLVVDLQLAELALRLLDLGVQAARFVLHPHQVQGTGQEGEQQHDVEAGHPDTSVRSATRMIALRDLGLPRTSSAPGLTRSSALSFIGRGAANGARRSTTSRECFAMNCLTMRSSSEW